MEVHEVTVRTTVATHFTGTAGNHDEFRREFNKRCKEAGKYHCSVAGCEHPEGSAYRRHAAHVMLSTHVGRVALVQTCASCNIRKSPAQFKVVQGSLVAVLPEEESAEDMILLVSPPAGAVSAVAAAASEAVTEAAVDALEERMNARFDELIEKMDNLTKMLR